MQLEGLKQQLAEAIAKAASFEGRFTEERALRRQVSRVLSCNGKKIIGAPDRSPLACTWALPAGSHEDVTPLDEDMLQHALSG